MTANEQSRELPKLAVEGDADGAIELDAVEVRSLAELWPYTSGTMHCPGGDHETMFLSQLPYVPLGDMRTVVSYPREPGDIADEVLRAALEAVALPRYTARLNDEADWAKVLSPGEQQRIAFARVLLTKPKAVFLDEATSALDEPLEFMIDSLVRRELPDTVFVSVTHRSTSTATTRCGWSCSVSRVGRSQPFVWEGGALAIVCRADALDAPTPKDPGRRTRVPRDASRLGTSLPLP